MKMQVSKVYILMKEAPSIFLSIRKDIIDASKLFWAGN